MRMGGGCTYDSAEINPQAGVDDGTCTNFQLRGRRYFDFDDNGDVGSADLLTFECLRKCVNDENEAIEICQSVGIQEVLQQVAR